MRCTRSPIASRVPLMPRPAAELKLRDGDPHAALNLDRKARMPASAVALVQRGQVPATPNVLERVATALHRAGLLEKAGAFFEQLGAQPRDAMPPAAAGDAMPRPPRPRHGRVPQGSRVPRRHRSRAHRLPGDRGGA